MSYEEDEDQEQADASTSETPEIKDQEVDQPQVSEEKSEDPFADLSKLRMSQEFADNLGVEKLLTKIQSGKPDRQSYFQIHPDPNYRLETGGCPHNR